MSDLRTECLAMAERRSEQFRRTVGWTDRRDLDNESDTIALLRRVADALEPKGDVVEAVAEAILDDMGDRRLLDDVGEDIHGEIGDALARAALAAYEPFVQARIREAVEGEREQCARWHADLAEGFRHRAATTRAEWTDPKIYSPDDRRANFADANEDDRCARFHDECAAAIRQQPARAAIEESKPEDGA